MELDGEIDSLISRSLLPETKKSIHPPSANFPPSQEIFKRRENIASVPLQVHNIMRMSSLCDLYRTLATIVLSTSVKLCNVTGLNVAIG